MAAAAWALALACPLPVPPPLGNQSTMLTVFPAPVANVMPPNGWRFGQRLVCYFEQGVSVLVPSTPAVYRLRVIVQILHRCGHI